MSAFIVIYMKHMLMQAAAELMLLVVHQMLGQCKCDAVPSFLMAASKCSLKLPPQFDFFSHLVSGSFHEKSNLFSIHYEMVARL